MVHGALLPRTPGLNRRNGASKGKILVFGVGQADSAAIKTRGERLNYKFTSLIVKMQKFEDDSASKETETATTTPMETDVNPATVGGSRDRNNRDCRSNVKDVFLTSKGYLPPPFPIRRTSDGLLEIPSPENTHEKNSFPDTCLRALDNLLIETTMENCAWSD